MRPFYSLWYDGASLPATLERDNADGTIAVSYDAGYCSVEICGIRDGEFGCEAMGVYANMDTDVNDGYMETIAQCTNTAEATTASPNYGTITKGPLAT